MKTERSGRVRVSSVASVRVLTLSTTVAGQTIRSASVAGTITDESGGVLPGATITLTSPALQVPQVVTISDARGQYQFVDLPVGQFRVAYELQGFSPLVREGIILSAGFNARVDVVMNVAAQETAIVVTGESPVVDPSSTRGITTVPREVLQTLPTASNYIDTLVLVPGARFPGPPMDGEIGYRGHTGRFTSYGLTDQTSLVIEGIEMVINERPDFDTIEEVTTRTYGNTAEVSFPGAQTEIIVRSGGNDLSGRYTARGMNRDFLGWTNVDDRLRAQRVTEPDGPTHYWNVTGDLGGRIIRDKLWFYVAHNEIHNLRTVPSYSKDPGPDGSYQTPDDTSGAPTGRNRNQTIKLSYQVTPRHKIVGFYTKGTEVEFQQGASRLVPFESTAHIVHTPRQKKLEWQGTLSERLYATLMVAKGWYEITFNPQDFARRTPNRLDRATGYQTGTNWHSNANLTRIPSRQQLTGSLSYYPAGSSHQIRAGFNQWWGRNQNIGGFHEAGGYQLIFDTIGGVPYTPVEMQVRNFPYDGRAGMNTLGLYVTDTWRPVDRLTFNLGVRGEAQTAFVPPQVKVQGPFGGSGSFPHIDAGSWKTLAPRAGVAWDLFGSGRTVIKGTLGKYYLHTGAFSDFAQAYNQNFAEWIHYRWHDLDGDEDYQPGEVDLDTNGPDYLRHAQGAPSNIVNPDLKLKSQIETTLSLEQDVGSGLSIRGAYIHKYLPEGSQTAFATINTLRPYSVWNQAFTRRDPGPDGVLNTADDDGLFTVYDYDPAFRGAAFVKNMRVPNDRPDTFSNYEISLNKRKSGKWFAMTSLVATKNHRWLSPVVQSPNDELFPLDETWDLAYRLAGGYDLPFGIMASTLVQVYNGFALQRTNQFRAVDPGGGPRFPSSSVIQLRMEPYGARHAPVRNVVNVRLSKSLILASGGRFVFDVDFTNVLNSNAAWGSPQSGDGNGQIEQSGPTFGYVTRIQQPRALRFGVSFSF